MYPLSDTIQKNAPDAAGASKCALMLFSAWRTNALFSETGINAWNAEPARKTAATAQFM
jgi:hypothetical protein